VKQEAKLSASKVPGEVVGSGEDDLRCRSLLIVCQRRLGLSEAEDTVQGWSSTLSAGEGELVVLLCKTAVDIKLLFYECGIILDSCDCEKPIFLGKDEGRLFSK